MTTRKEVAKALVNITYVEMMKLAEDILLPIKEGDVALNQRDDLATLLSEWAENYLEELNLDDE